MFELSDRAQGAIEYLLLLSAVLVVVSTTVYLLQSSTGGLGENIQGRIEDVENIITTELTRP